MKIMLGDAVDWSESTSDSLWNDISTVVGAVEVWVIHEDMLGREGVNVDSVIELVFPGDDGEPKCPITLGRHLDIPGEEGFGEEVAWPDMLSVDRLAAREC